LSTDCKALRDKAMRGATAQPSGSARVPRAKPCELAVGGLEVADRAEDLAVGERERLAVGPVQLGTGGEQLRPAGLAV
jgi:hypothetical protein